MPEPSNISSRSEDAGIQLLRETRKVVILSLIAWRTPPERYGAWESVASNIAMDPGSCREGIDEGLTGQLVDSVKEAIATLDRIDGIDPAACRQRVEKQVSIDSMLDGYERVYANFFSNSSGGTNRSRSGVE